MYSVADYLWMLADDTRASAYADAIRTVVRPGDRVLEVGAGFGFFSVIAARAGAQRVDAVDTNPAVLLGPRLAEANGCADRIVFHHADVEQLSLPHEVDVVISDLRGPTPFARRSLATVIDVRRRMLRDGGTIVPRADTVFAAPCHVPAAVRRDVHAAFGREGIDTTPVERIIKDTPYRCTIHTDDLVAPGRAWTRVEYAAVDTPDAQGEAEWAFANVATVSGFAIWFATELTGDIGFSSEPGAPARVYNQIFLPLSAPVKINARDTLNLDVSVRLVLNEYLWAWTVRVLSPDRKERLVLRQNSIADAVIDPEFLRRHAARV